MTVADDPRDRLVNELAAAEDWPGLVRAWPVLEFYPPAIAAAADLLRRSGGADAGWTALAEFVGAVAADPADTDREPPPRIPEHAGNDAGRAVDFLKDVPWICWVEHTARVDPTERKGLLLDGLAAAEAHLGGGDAAFTAFIQGIRGRALYELGRSAKAASAMKEAVEGYRIVHGARSAVYAAPLATAFLNLGTVENERGRPRAALGPLRSAEVLFRRLARRDIDRAVDHLRALNALGAASRSLGRLRSARRALVRARRVGDGLAKAGRPGWEFFTGIAATNLGDVLRELGRPALAVARFREAAALFARVPEEGSAAVAPIMAGLTANLGAALRDANQLREAAEAYAGAVHAYEEHATGLGPQRLRFVRLLVDFAALLVDLREFATAHERCSQAIAVCATVEEDQPELASVLNVLGIVLRDLGRHDEAEDTLRRALTTLDALREEEPEAYVLAASNVLCNLGLVARDRGRLSEAVAHYTKALAPLGEVSTRPRIAGRAVALNNRGAALTGLGRTEEGQADLLAAVNLFDRLAARNPTGYLEGRGTAWANLGDLGADAGDDPVTVRSAYARSVEAFERFRELFGPDLRHRSRIQAESGDVYERLFEAWADPDDPTALAEAAGVAEQARARVLAELLADIPAPAAIPAEDAARLERLRAARRAAALRLRLGGDR